MNPFAFKPWFKNRHIQTLLASRPYWRPWQPKSQLQWVELADKDRLALEVSTPKKWRNNMPTIVLVHGLGGSANSAYMRRTATMIFRKLGWRVVRVNLRNCGRGLGMAKHTYHGGQSDDLLAVLKYLKAYHPSSSIMIIGFSLGGNIALKLAGELGGRFNNLCQKLIAISAPAQLEPCAQRLLHGFNRIYDWYFIRKLKTLLTALQNKFPDTKITNFTHWPKSIYEFDQMHTAPAHQFASREAYYSRASCGLMLATVTCSTLIVLAQDDPFVLTEDYNGLILSPSIQLCFTQHGGHMGFVGMPFSKNGGINWLTTQLKNWLTTSI